MRWIGYEKILILVLNTMERNEIRMRRQRMSAGNIARHRNYGDLLLRHERDQRLKRMFRLFIYFLLAAFLVILFVIILRWEKRKNDQKRTTPVTSAFLQASFGSPYGLLL